MSEQYGNDPNLPPNPQQPSGSPAGYPPQQVPCVQPNYGLEAGASANPLAAAAGVEELPEKPAYRGTVVAVLAVGILAAIMRIIDVFMAFYLNSQWKRFAREFGISESELGVTNSSPRGMIFAVFAAVLFISLAWAMKKGNMKSALGLTAVAGFYTVIYVSDLSHFSEALTNMDDGLANPDIPQSYDTLFTGTKFGIYLEFASIAVQILLIILIWLPTTLKYMKKAQAYYGAVEAQKPENQPVDASTLMVPGASGEQQAQQAPVAQNPGQAGAAPQGYGYDAQANPAQQNNVPQNSQKSDPQQGNGGYNLN